MVTTKPFPGFMLYIDLPAHIWLVEQKYMLTATILVENWITANNVKAYKRGFWNLFLSCLIFRECAIVGNYFYSVIRLHFSLRTFRFLCFTRFLFILHRWLTTLRLATFNMAFHSAKRYTQVNLKRSQNHPLVSNDVPSVSGNPSPSRNTQDSSNTHNDIAAKSKKKIPR